MFSYVDLPPIDWLADIIEIKGRFPATPVFLLDSMVLIRVENITGNLKEFVNQMLFCSNLQIKILPQVLDEVFKNPLAPRATELLGIFLKNSIIANPLFISGHRDIKGEKQKHVSFAVNTNNGLKVFNGFEKGKSPKHFKKVSTTDYTELHFAYSLKEFVLVSNDKDLVANAKQLLGSRVWCLEEFLNYLQANSPNPGYFASIIQNSNTN